MQYNTENKFPPFFLEKAYMLKVLSYSFGGVYIHVDQRVPGVEIPPEKEDDDFFIDVEQGNVVIDHDKGLQILIFAEGEEDSDREPFTCKIPWEAIYIFRHGPEFLAIWIESTPQPILEYFVDEKILPDAVMDSDNDVQVWLSGRMQWGLQFAFASMEVWLDGWENWKGSGETKVVLTEDSEDPKHDDISSMFSVITGGKEPTEIPTDKSAEEVGVSEHLRIVTEESEDDDVPSES